MWFMVYELGYNLSFSNWQLYLSLKVKVKVIVSKQVEL